MEPDVPYIASSSARSRRNLAHSCIVAYRFAAANLTLTMRSFGKLRLSRPARRPF